MIVSLKSRKLLRHTLVIIVLLVSQTIASAQRFELGGGIGATHYKGEIYPSFKPFAFNGGANAFARLNLIRSGISAKATVMIGNLSADDRRVNSLFHKERGLKFNTSFYEVGGQVEYNFLHFRSTHLRNSDWTPYVFGGYARFSTINRTFTTTTTIADPAKPLEPEDQRQIPTVVGYDSTRNSSTRTIVIPFGIGVKKMLAPRLNLTIEFGSRKVISSDLSDLVIDNLGYRFYKATNDIQPNFSGAAASNFPDLRRFATPNNRTQDMYFYTNVSISYLFGDVICPTGYRVPLFKRLFQ